MTLKENKGRKAKKGGRSLVELRRLGRALERERRRSAGAHDRRHGVEVARADLALVLGRGVAASLGGELGLRRVCVCVWSFLGGGEREKE